MQPPQSRAAAKPPPARRANSQPVRIVCVCANNINSLFFASFMVFFSLHRLGISGCTTGELGRAALRVSLKHACFSLRLSFSSSKI